jgi:hypothetical protein
MKRVTIALTLLFLVLASNSYAGSIGVADFTSPSIFTYNDLSLPIIETTYNTTQAPFTLDGNTYSSNVDVLRYTNFTGCYDKQCIGTRYSDSYKKNIDDYIDIVFGTPIQKVGGWIGISSGNVDFFGTDGSLLGSLSVFNIPTGTTEERREFAGWDAESGLIQRIRITDTDKNGYVITFDNLYTEGSSAVPIPPSVWLLGAGLVGLAGLRRKFFRN